jgi:hypothetical protein
MREPGHPSKVPSNAMERQKEYRRTLIVVRYVLPSLLCLAGLVVIAIDPHGSTLHGGLGTAPQIAPAEASEDSEWYRFGTDCCVQSV